MATNTEVGVKITVDGSDAVQSVGSIKKQLREATQDLIAMREKFGETSAEAVAAAKRVANLKDEIGDAKAMTEAFNPDAKFKGLGAALQGVAGGFAAIQGAQAIFGAESKDLEKTLLKVQGAMALTQGINSVLEAKDSFKVLKTVAIDAFKGIKTAIGSTGIGLLVVALGTLVAYWDDIKEAVSGVSEEQTKLNETTKKNLEAEQNKLKAIGDQDNILKLQGKSEKEILQIKIKQYDATIKAAEAQIQSEAEIQKVKEQAAKRNYDLTKNIIRGSMEFGMVALRVLAAPIDLVIATANKAAEILGFEKIVTENINDQITKLTTTASETLAKFLFDPEETKKEGEKTVKEAKDNLAKLKNERAGLQLSIQKIDEDAAKKKIDDDKKLADERLKLEEEAAKKLLELKQANELASIEDDRKRSERKLQLDFENQKKEIEQSKYTAQEKNNLILELEKKLRLDLDAIAEQEAKKQEEKAIKDAEASAQKSNEKRKREYEAQQQRIEDEKKAAEARIKIDEAETQTKIDNAKSIGDTVSQLSDLIGKETAAGKAAAVAAAAINTYAAAWTAFTQGQKNPISIGFPAYPYIQAGLAVAGGLANIRKIIAVKTPKASGGGSASVPSGGAPTVPNAPLPPQAETTLLNQGQVNQIGNVAARAYVVESDVSGNQQRIQRLERAARIA